MANTLYRLSRRWVGSEEGLAVDEAQRDPANQPSATAAVRSEVIDTARRIVAGELPPHEGAANIWRVMAEINYEGLEDLRGWVGFASEWQDSPEHREVIELDILEAAERLAKHG